MIYSEQLQAVLLVPATAGAVSFLVWAAKVWIEIRKELKEDKDEQD